MSSASMRLIVMGTGGVGKSAFTGRYVSPDEWNPKYDPTIEELKTKTIKHEGKALQLEILDTAGQEQYSALRESFMSTGHGFVLVFSIVDDQTLEDLKKIITLIQTSNPNKNIPLIIVGNKCDLASERAVETEEAMQFAQGFGAEYIEASAKNNENVSSAFESLIAKVLTSDSSIGFGSGSGSVMGAGEKAPEAVIPQMPQQKATQKKKKDGCNIL
jgi:small GTP-binding protein